MINANPYLHFMGNTEAAMNYYRSIFGGEFTAIHRFKDFPGGEKMPPADQDKIIHMSLPLASSILMATDMLESMEQTLTAGNNFHVCIHTESQVETEKLFNALATGGQIKMPLNTTFWGAYFGMCRDKFGIQWMISYEPKPTA